MAWFEALVGEGRLLGPVDATAIARIVLAALLGGLIGWEREHHGRAAGLRTHMLLCTGCALLMLISLHVPTLFYGVDSDGLLRADPTRMAAHVISGVGFLGAGTIIVLGKRVMGLTTAASVWVTAALGLAVGCGYVAVALFAWAVAMFALLALARVERKMVRKDRYIRLRLEFPGPTERSGEIERLLEEHGIEMLTCTVDRAGEKAVYDLVVKYTSPLDFEELTADLSEGFGDQAPTNIRWV